MTTKKITTSGQQAIFQSAYTPIDVLDEICERHKIKSPFATFTPQSALKQALQTIFRNGSHGKTFIDEGKKGTFCIIRREVLEDGNTYDMQNSCWVDNDNNVQSRGDDGGIDEIAEVQTEVDRLLKLVPTGRVTTGLGLIAIRHFNATRMTSGCFFIGVKSLDKWLAFADDYDAVTATTNKIHRVILGVDPESAATVMATASTDLQARYEDALQRLERVGTDDDEDTPAARKSKAKRRNKINDELDDISKMVDEFESSFGTVSADLKQIKDTIVAETTLANLASFMTN